MNRELEILQSVYETRRKLLWNSLDAEMRCIFFSERSPILKDVDHLLHILKGMKKDRFLFSFYFFIKISCCWEAYALNPDGSKRFQKYCYDAPVQLLAISHLSKFKFSIINKLYLEIFEDHLILEKAKNNLKNNLKLLEEIVQLDITCKDLDDYFDDVKFYSFDCDDLKDYLHGFSSYDGKYVYISLKELDDKPLTEIIECQVVDNIYFWLIKNENPLLIMSEINNQLLYEGFYFEPSDYYILHAYNRQVVYEGPFKLSTKNQMWIF